MTSIRWDGQRISKPGIYVGIPLTDYHRGDICDGPSISSSGLRKIWDKSPKHYWDASPLNPNRSTDGDENADFILGSAAHHLICGEVGFSQLYAVRPDKAPDGREWHGSNKTCREWLADQARKGKTVLTPGMVEAIRGMAVSLNAHPLVQQGILNGMVERSMFWRDPETGVWLKARPDVVPTESGDFADLKTTQSTLYIDLQYSLGTYGYHQQGALVLEGARALDMHANSFSLVWVEKKRPHCVRVQTIDDEDLARGGRQNRVALRMFHECFVSRSWPGPGDDRDDAELVRLSDRMRERIDERLKLQLREAA